MKIILRVVTQIAKFLIMQVPQLLTHCILLFGPKNNEISHIGNLGLCVLIYNEQVT
jgi:hypothetical protein